MPIKKDFVRSMTVQGMRFRWFTCNTTEIQLANGKYILVDPFLPSEEDKWGKMGMACGYTVDDLEGADYVIITHAHGDHILQLKEIWERFHPRILVHESTAIYYSRFFKIPERDFLPFSNHETYDLGDFILQTSEGRHNDTSKARPYVYREIPSLESEEWLGTLGSLYNTNFLIKANDGLTVGFSAGEWDALAASRWYGQHVNVLFRHRTNWQMDPKEMAEIIAGIGAEISFPWHQNNAYDPNFNYDMNEFSENVDKALQEMGSTCRFMNPERGKWHRISLGCHIEE